MAHNHRDKIFAMGVRLQTAAGSFDLPTQADLVAVSSPEGGRDPLEAPDPTETGSIWEQEPIFLGETGTGGATIPLRGPGGVAPPAANAFTIGRIMQGCGFSEIRRATEQAATALGVGSTATQMVLANSESSVDDFLVGTPIRSADIGSGFRGTTLIQDYIGATRTAVLAETLGGVPTADYILPASLSYVLGTMTVTPPVLSISIWRDKKRYDFRDCVINSWSIDSPVANEQNLAFPSLQFGFKGVPVGSSADTTPTLPQSILSTQPPPNRAGKFYLDRVQLSHASTRFNIGLEASAPPNANQDTGQDGYDIISGTRGIELDLNQMDVSEFDVDQRIADRTVMPLLNTWGGVAGNRIGMLIPALRLTSLRPGSRNGYVSLAGGAGVSNIDKGFALSFFY